MATYHTVVKGDTLTAIANKYGTTVSAIAKLNHITNVNLIYVGQKLQIDGTTSSTSTTNNTNAPKILHFGLQSTSDKVLFATWAWAKANSHSYLAKWEYKTKDQSSVWFVGSNSTITIDRNDPESSKQSTYTIPSNATVVRFTVKAIAATNPKTNQAYWTGSWSTAKTYTVTDAPIKPAVPSVSLEDYKVIAILDNLNVNATVINFQIVKRVSKGFQIVFTSATTIRYSTTEDQTNLTNGYARFSWYVDPGGEYKVRVRSCKNGLYSEWSEYSESLYTMPSGMSGFTSISAKSETSVLLTWDAVDSAKSYDVEYTTEERYFDTSSETTVKTGITGTSYEVTGLESGDEYFFRVRAVNDSGPSAWSTVSSIVIGEEPSAPTTWSSTTTAIVGEPLTLYWVHNAQDNSNMSSSQLELYINGSLKTYILGSSSYSDSYISYTPLSEDDLDDNKAIYCSVDTTAFGEGTKLEWRVCTAGITGVYGDWSIKRTVDIYAPATLSLVLKDNNMESMDTLSSFPFYIHAVAGPSTQQALGYYVSITSNSEYETLDNMGNVKMVGVGEEVYSKYFDTSDELLLEMSPSNINLENNVTYNVYCVVSMNSGLTAEASSFFTVGWSDELYWPNAEIGVDTEAYTAVIRPFCKDEEENLIEGLTLSVYRREFDGSFTELMTGIPNDLGTCVTDPHPALDYARYRIVAISDSTGAISYYDMPGYKVGGNAVIIQWNEAWSNFDSPDENVPFEPTWAGSLLKLPYNVDVSDDYKPDVTLVEYIGRSHPVSYYGTQLGVSSSWKVEIPYDDEETLYGLRRLSRWLGDAYVREPYGTGYWANVSVSFSQTHLKTTIPVSIDVTRVEGGA